MCSSQSKERLSPLVDLPVRQLFNSCVIQHTAPLSVCKTGCRTLTAGYFLTNILKQKHAGLSQHMGTAIDTTGLVTDHLSSH